MEFLIGRNELLKGLKKASKAINKTVVPICECFKIEIQGNKGYITGSNMEMFIKTSVELKSEIQSLSICVKSKLLLEFISKCAEQPVKFIIIEELVTGLYSLKIEISSGTYDLPLENAQDYPVIPEVGIHMFDIDSSETIINALERTLFAIDINIPKEHFRNLLIDFGNGISFVGCDVTQMGVVDVLKNTVNKKQCLISKHCAEAFKGYAPKGPIKIGFDDRNLFLLSDNGDLFSTRLSVNEYPAYKGVIPKDHSCKVTGNIQELKTALDRVRIFSDSQETVLFEFTENSKLKISTMNIDFSTSASEEVSCDYIGDDMRIQLSASKVIDILNRIDGDEYFLGLNNKMAAALFRSTDPEITDYLFLAMPILLED